MCVKPLRCVALSKSPGSWPQLTPLHSETVVPAACWVRELVRGLSATRCLHCLSQGHVEWTLTHNCGSSGLGTSAPWRKHQCQVAGITRVSYGNGTLPPAALHLLGPCQGPANGSCRATPLMVLSHSSPRARTPSLLCEAASCRLHPSDSPYFCLHLLGPFI